MTSRRAVLAAAARTLAVAAVPAVPAGLTFGLVTALSGCAGLSVPLDVPSASTGSAPTITDLSTPPPAPREMRAAWVATVANIDWPSRKGLSTRAQQDEVRALLNRAAALKLNAIFLQVRPCADALYPSALEPWSEYLSGVQGQAPAPLYDPLAFWIEQAHVRGLELHAWFNPFRARLGEGKSALAPTHVSQAQPQWVKAYGNQLWMDPGEPAAASHSQAVILDVLDRYDVDGIHLDDYFYPYPVTLGDEAKTDLDFPDGASWSNYVGTGGTLGRDDWRRSNVDSFVQRLNTSIHQRKPWVRFGISPFGIGKPDSRPAGIVGFSQYHKLYADVERWLQAGWVDYLVPQLYWPLAQTEQAFAVLLDYWQRQNTQGRHVWAGLFTSKVLAAPGANAVATKSALSVASAGSPGDAAIAPALLKGSWPAAEITQQISAVRQRAPGSGHAHFSMVALLQNRQGLADRLTAGPYVSAALVPASPWLQAGSPMSPVGTANSGAGSVHISLSLPTGSVPAQRWAVWLRYGTRWVFSVRTQAQFAVAMQQAPAGSSDDRLAAVVVSALDRVGNESPRVSLQF